MAIAKFQRGSFGRSGGTYECACCGRLTRRTQSGQSDQCAQCDEASMIENGISDNDLEGAELAHAEACILALKESAAKAGGSRERLGLT